MLFKLVEHFSLLQEEFNYKGMIQEFTEDGSIYDVRNEALLLIEFFKNHMSDFCDRYEYYKFDPEEGEYTDIPLDYEELKEYVNEMLIIPNELIDNLLEYESDANAQAYFFARGFDEYIDGEDDNSPSSQDREQGLNTADLIASKRETQELIPLKTLRDEAETFLITQIGGCSCKDCTRGFILTGGDCVKTSQIVWDNKVKHPPHKKADEIILNHLVSKFDTDKQTILKSLEISKVYGIGQDDSLIADKFNWVRVNGSNENYILIPKNKITYDQADVLEKWIDNFFSTHRKDTPIKVTAVLSNEKYMNQQSYYQVDADSLHMAHDGSDVVKKIMKYYNTGKLEESKKRMKR